MIQRGHVEGFTGFPKRFLLASGTRERSPYLRSGATGSAFASKPLR
jgi:hypothetical protein